jgi:hypothetical protein
MATWSRLRDSVSNYRVTVRFIGKEMTFKPMQNNQIILDCTIIIEKDLKKIPCSENLTGKPLNKTEKLLQTFGL